MGGVSNIEIIDIGSNTGNAATVIGLGDAFFTNNASVTVNANSSTAGTDADTKVDAGAVSSGAVTMVLRGDLTGVNDTLVGGAGDDTLQIGYVGLAAAADQELEAGDTFTGNGGTDTILFNTAADSSTSGAGAITATIDFDAVTGVEKILVADADGAVAADADAIIVNLSTSVTTANVPAAFEYDGSVKTDALDTQQFNYAGAYVDATDADNAVLTTAFTLKGGWGADSLYGSAGTDSIVGGIGADTLAGFGQSDTIEGGSGADLINGGDETALTGVGDSLLGGSGDDTINGNAGADTISGGDGADVITGGTGADNLTGGSGADEFEVDTWAESGGSNLDTITDFVSGTDTIQITVTAAQMDALGAGINFAATDLGDVATFGEVEAILSGVSGQTVFVTGLNQIVIDANGDSNINASDFRINLTDATAYDNADITWVATADNDTARSYTLGDGADSFAGGGGADTVYGLGGADIISGGAGIDVIYGGAGNDTLSDGAAKDFIHHGAGNDIITLAGTTDDDTIVAAGVTTAAPYVVANNGTNTVTTVTVADTVFQVWALAGLNGTTGGSDGSYTYTDTVIAATTATPLEMNANVRIIDNALDPEAGTTTLIASYIQTTTNTGNNYAKMADNGAGILVHGDDDGVGKLYIYWIDSLIDGDGTDVTAADVHLLYLTTNDITDADSLTSANFDV
jgi:Ca2+-binding RTX toxin-like protein